MASWVAALPATGPQGRCRLFGRPEGPAVCASLRPSPEMCGPPDDGGARALRCLSTLERATGRGG
ncbi:proteinase inhibitor [Ottowia sp.]|uniref:proteinase inhibitor n=1 Tax=Ottowia sp. TaxID=1898956 RepID=UPI002BF0D301|nr:proteinase inhibitor [Ottowia sp.]HNR82470.1 proteinase inhibitor [Ottowia sp.]